MDAVLEGGYPVVPVKPTALKAWRESEVPSGAKSNASDAEVIAEYLRLKARRLGSAVPYSEETKALCTVSRTRTDLVAARVAATNQLAALVDAHWPGAKEVFADIATFEMPPHDTDDKGRGGRSGVPALSPQSGLDGSGAEFATKPVRDHQVVRAQIVHGRMSETQQSGIDAAAHDVEDVLHARLTVRGQAP